MCRPRRRHLNRVIAAEALSISAPNCTFTRSENRKSLWTPKFTPQVPGPRTSQHIALGQMRIQSLAVITNAFTEELRHKGIQVIEV
jgi:hypothetical protein